MDVKVTKNAALELQALSPVIRARVVDLFERLAKWPAVSGVKPLRHSMKGSFRLRTGDYRIIFHVEAGVIIVTKIANRRDVYEE